MLIRGGSQGRPAERLAIIAVLITLAWPGGVESGAASGIAHAAGIAASNLASAGRTTGRAHSSLNVPDDPPPAAPTGLTATPGNNSVSLSWTPNTEPDLAGYNVYRAGGGAGGPTVQAVGAGDIASCSSSGDEATAALLSTISGDVLAIGDTVYDSGTAAEYTNCYHPSWGAYKTRTRPIVGNHEYGTANASGYFNYFGAAAGTQGQGWYSYDYGTWHVIVLNSMCSNVGGCGTGSPQLTWLVGDLADSDAQCTLALWHHPLTSSSRGVNTVTQPLFQALYDANADLILTGHDHTYERFAPQTATRTLDNNRGIRQFVVGTGGRSHYSFDNLQPNSEVRNGDTYGVIKLQLKPTGYDWEFVPEAGKTFTDSGSDECHDANGPIAPGQLNGGTLLSNPSFTDITAVNGISYDYVVTAVDDAGQESLASAGVSATPVASPPGSTTYASDTFSRTVNDNWGTATTGGAYTLTGTAANYDVTGSVGTMALAAGVSRTAALASVSAQDGELGFRFTSDKTPTAGSLYIYGAARRVSATTSYRVKLRIAPNGQVFVHASQVIGNVETGIGSEVLVAGLTHTPGAFIRLRAQVSGTNPTTIRIRAWATGTTEPTSWLYTATNSAASLQTAGGVGLLAYLSGSTTNGPVLVTFDDFLVTSIGAPPANTAPVVDAVTISPSSPTTNQTLTANVTSHDADGNALTTAYQWTRNGTDIAGATGATLNLATAGNGDRGDLIRVRVTVNDGVATSTPVTSSPVTVSNTAPTATVSLSPSNPTTNQTLTATATKNDADLDPVSLTFVWKVNGGTVRTFSSPTALVDTLDLSVAGNGDPGQVVSVEVTPNDGTVNGTMVSAQVTVASSSTTYASDTFSRTVNDNWGTATTGGAYTLTGTAANYDVTGSVGTMALAAGVSRTAALASVSAQDGELGFRFTSDKTPTAGSLYIYGAARRVSATTSYRVKLRIAPNGQVFVHASQVIGNVETGIGSEVLVAGLTHTPGAFIRLRAQVSGTNPTTIRIRAWATGTTEPTSWLYTATNSAASLQTAGGVGLLAYLSGSTTNGPVLVTFDDFLVTSIP